MIEFLFIFVCGNVMEMILYVLVNGNVVEMCKILNICFLYVFVVFVLWKYDGNFNL